MRSFAPAALAALALSASALADQPVPLVLTQQGYLVDADDAPVDNASASLKFELHESPDSSIKAPVWSETKSVAIAKGRYAVLLGEGTPIPASVLQKPRLFLSVTIGGSELLPRQRLGTAAYALRAATADRADSAALADDAQKFGGKEPSHYATSQQVQDLGAQITSGALTQGAADARYVSRTGDATISGAVTATSFTGSGAGLTGIPVSAVQGALSASSLPNDLARTGAANAFTGTNTFAGPSSFSGATTLGAATVNTSLTLGASASLSLAGRPLTGFRAENADSAPVACNPAARGYIFFDTTLGAFRGCDGSDFVVLQTTSNSIVRSGLILHLDAADTNSYAGTGSVWKDVSGAGGSAMGDASMNPGDWSYVTTPLKAMRNTTPNTASGAAVATASGGISVSLAKFSKQEGTIEMWIRPTQYTDGNGLFVNNEVARANPADWLWFGIWANGTHTFLRIGDGSACCVQELAPTPTNIPLNQWSQVFASWSQASKTIRIGRNGATFLSRAITNIPATNPAATGRIGLGHESTNSEFIGDIAIVRFYNRPISDAEAAQNYTIQRSRFGL